MKFTDAIKYFLDHCAVERRLSPHTLEAYECDLTDFYRWLLPASSSKLVNDGRLRAYLNEMVSIRNLSPATVKRRLASLRSLFRFLNERFNEMNPFATWHPKLPKCKRLPRALAKTELSALLRSFSKENPFGAKKELQTALTLMVATGLRVGELCRLSVADISPDGGTLHVHGKGSRDRIAYVADPSLQKAIQRLLVRRQKAAGDRGILLVNTRGGPMRPQSVRTKLRRLAKDAGLKRRVTPHMLRHTAATLLIESGVDIRFVQRLLGHSSIATTEIYTHVTDEALRKTLEQANVLSVLRQRN